MCVRASMKAAKPLHIVLATNPNPTRARGYPLNINPKPDPKPDSISGPAGSGRVADLYFTYQVINAQTTTGTWRLSVWIYLAPPSSSSAKRALFLIGEQRVIYKGFREQL